MQRVVQTVRMIARHEMDQHPSTALAVVKGVQGSNGEKRYSCTVELRESGLVLSEVPIATGLIGTASLPREEDLVLLIFVGGDLHAPVVIGRLYNEEVAPPKNAPGEFVAVLPGDEGSEEKRLELRVKTPGDGSREVRLRLAGSVEVLVVVKDDGIELKAQDTVLKLTQTSSSDGKAELKVGESSVVLEQGGDVTIEAAGTLTLKAVKVEISGDTTVKVAGQTVELN